MGDAGVGQFRDGLSAGGREPAARVVLLVPTRTWWLDRVMRGVAARRPASWRLEIRPAVAAGGLQGVGAVLALGAQVPPAVVAQVPVVTVGLTPPDPGPTAPFGALAPSGWCGPDAAGVAAAVAGHFSDRGLRALAWLGVPGEGRAADHPIVAALQALQPGPGGLVRISPLGEGERAARGPDGGLRAALLRLSRPCGLVAETHELARAAVEAAWRAGLRVPADLAILSIEEDSIAGMLCDPTISALDVPGEAVGAAAVDLLRKMLAGGVGDRVSVSPAGVLERGSTEYMYASDPLVAHACELLTANLATIGQVDDVLTHLDVSRRTLEQRFQASLAMTPGGVIRFLRTRRARHLLRDSGLGIEAVAERSGFRGGAAMLRGLRAAFGEAAAPAGWTDEAWKHQREPVPLVMSTRAMPLMVKRVGPDRDAGAQVNSRDAAGERDDVAEPA